MYDEINRLYDEMIDAKRKWKKTLEGHHSNKQFSDEVKKGIKTTIANIDKEIDLLEDRKS